MPDMRHTQFKNKYGLDEDTLYNARAYTARCIDCKSFIKVDDIAAVRCARCRIKKEARIKKKAAVNKKKSQIGLLGTLKRRISAAVQRSMHQLHRRRIEDPNIDMKYLVKLYEEQEGRCALSGRSLSLGSLELNKYDPNVLSIDRKDPTKGYVVGNVQFTTYQANVAKGRHSNEEFFQLCRDVIETQNKRIEKASESEM